MWLDSAFLQVVGLFASGFEFFGEDGSFHLWICISALVERNRPTTSAEGPSLRPHVVYFGQVSQFRVRMVASASSMAFYLTLEPKSGCFVPWTCCQYLNQEQASAHFQFGGLILASHLIPVQNQLVASQES